MLLHHALLASAVEVGDYVVISCLIGWAHPAFVRPIETGLTDQRASQAPGLDDEGPRRSSPLRRPRLEADVLHGSRCRVPARQVTLTARSAARTYRSDILEPARHTIPQRTPSTSAHRVHVRQLDAQPQPVQEARTARFVENRLD